MTKSLNYKNKGFTLLEILLVVGIISILAGIIILAINPTKQLGDTRNAQRRADVLTIMNAIYQFSIDNHGNMDTINNGSTLPDGSGSTCAANVGTDAKNLRDSLVGNDAVYLTDIPHDPSISVFQSGDNTEYYVVQSSSTGRISVCAPDVSLETNNTAIQVTR